MTVRGAKKTKIVRRTGTAVPAEAHITGLRRPERDVTDTEVPLRFPADTDIAVVWEEVLKGGESRRDVVARLHARFRGQTTRSGNPKPVSTVLNQVLARARAAGYTIDSHWRVVPPPGDHTSDIGSARTARRLRRPLRRPHATG